MYSALYICLVGLCIFALIIIAIKVVSIVKKREIKKAQMKLFSSGCSSVIAILYSIAKTSSIDLYVPVEVIHLTRCQNVLEFQEYWPLLCGTKADLEELFKEGRLEKELRVNKITNKDISFYRLRQRPVLRLVA